jgi:hypothetical protein
MQRRIQPRGYLRTDRGFLYADAAPVQDGGSSRAFKRWGGVTRQASLIGDNPEKNSNASLFLTAIAALISEDSEVLAWR